MVATTESGHRYKPLGTGCLGLICGVGIPFSERASSG